jgi:hypothetical protein
LLITSPPFRVPKARQVATSIPYDTKRTPPSPKQTFTPPGCRLLAVVMMRKGENMQEAFLAAVLAEYWLEN